MPFTAPISVQDKQWCVAILAKGLELERRGDAQAAVAHFIQARDRIGHAIRAPNLWAMTHLNLGGIYQKLSETNDLFLQPAIDACIQAIANAEGAMLDQMGENPYVPVARLVLRLDAGTALSLAMDWSQGIQSNPASARYLLPLMSEMRSMIDAQHSLFFWATLTMALANGFRNYNDGIANYHARAIALYREGLAKSPPDFPPLVQAAFQGELGYTLTISLSGDRAQNIEDAIAALQAASQAFHDENELGEYATSMASLCNAYIQRIKGERADNIEHAIHACKQAIAAREASDDSLRAMLVVQLAETYLLRIQGTRSENIEYALGLLKPLLLTPAAQHDMESRKHLNGILGRLYLERVEGISEENIDLALAANKETARLCESGGRDWIVASMNLATSYLRRLSGERSENLREGIAVLASARAALSREAMPLDWADLSNNLGAAHIALARESAGAEAAAEQAQAIEYFQQALAVRTLDAFPIDHRTIQRNRGTLHFAAGQWRLAWEAYQAAILAGERLLDGAYTEAGRLAEIDDDLSYFAEASYCLLQLGERDLALRVLDSGKTRLLRTTLALGDADLDQLEPDERKAIAQRRQAIRALEASMQLSSTTDVGAQQLAIAAALRAEREALKAQVAACKALSRGRPVPLESVAELSELAQPGGVLIVPFLTRAGGAVFVLPAGTAVVGARHIVWLDADAAAALGAIADRAHEGKPASVCFYDLWQYLMMAVVTRLNTLGIGAGAPLLLMPQGTLAALPLHAARRSTGVAMRSIIDDYPVTYAPGGYVMARCRARAAEPVRTRTSLLAVVNPTGDLPFAELEGEVIAAHFDAATSRLLRGFDATVQAVIDSVHDKSVLHFSCHHHYDAERPMRSALMLADGTLSISDIVKSMDLGAVRLVTLSACATGLTERIESPDEFRGLANEFLQAGAAAVLCTLWPIDDLAAMLLMERFYHLLLVEAMPPARALQAAQGWLKGLTAAEIAQRMAREEDRLLEHDGEGLAAASEQFERFYGLREKFLPFADAYQSAAFVLVGA